MMKSNFLLLPVLFCLFSFSHCSIKKPNGGGTYDGGIPTYNEVNDHLNDILKGPVKDAKCLDLKDDLRVPQDNSIYPYGNPLNGALAVHATKYQSCMILNNIGGSIGFDGVQPDKVLNKWRSSNPSLYPDKNPLCKDANTFKKFKAEKVDNKFGYEVVCSHLNYCQGKRAPSVSNNEIDVFKNSTDCSGFVSTSFRAVGLKMNKSQIDNDWWPPTTYDINKNLSDPNSCFESPVSELNDLVRSGDILNSSSGHVVMIDKVGKDPFRIEEIMDQVKDLTLTKEKALESCMRLNTSRFNLGIIHSTTARNSTAGDGVIREHSSAIVSATAREILQEYARNACVHFVSQYPESDEPFNTMTGIKKAYGGRGTYQRHKGTKEPDCVFPSKPKIKGEECVSECINNYTI